MEVRLLSPASRLRGRERKSKLLDPESELYQRLKILQDRIRTEICDFDQRMDLHIEILNRTEDSEEIARERSAQIHTRMVETKDAAAWAWVGQAFALLVGRVEGYQQTQAHITIAWLGRSGLTLNGDLHTRLRTMAADVMALPTPLPAPQSHQPRAARSTTQPETKDLTGPTLPVLLASPHELARGERRSKLLDPTSELYQRIKKLQAVVRSEVFDFDERMDLHVELLNRDEGGDVANVRSREVHGRPLHVTDPRVWGWCGKAFALDVGAVAGYRGTPHVTVAFLGRSALKLDAELLERLRKMATQAMV